MPIVVQYEPLAQLTALARQRARIADYQDKQRRDLGLLQWVADQNQRSADRTESQYRFDQTLAADRAATPVANPNAASGGYYVKANDPAFTGNTGKAGQAISNLQRLQLSALDEAQRQGLVDPQQALRAQLGILGGDRDPLGQPPSTAAGDRLELDRQRFDLQKSQIQQSADRRGLLDKIAQHKANLAAMAKNPEQKYSPAFAAEQEALDRAFEALVNSQNAAPGPPAPTAAGAGVINPATQPAGPTTRPASGAPGGKAISRALIRQYLQQNGGNIDVAKARARAQGWDVEAVSP